MTTSRDSKSALSLNLVNNEQSDRFFIKPLVIDPDNYQIISPINTTIVNEKNIDYTTSTNNDDKSPHLKYTPKATLLTELNINPTKREPQHFTFFKYEIQQYNESNKEENSKEMIDYCVTPSSTTSSDAAELINSTNTNSLFPT